MSDFSYLPPDAPASQNVNPLQGVVRWTNRVADVVAVSAAYGVMAGALTFAASPLFAAGAVAAALVFSRQTMVHLPQNAKPSTRSVVDHFTTLSGLPTVQIAETDLCNEQGSDQLQAALAHAVPGGVALSKVFVESNNLRAQAAILGHEIGHHIYGDKASRLLRQGAVLTSIFAGTTGLVAAAFSAVSGVGALALLGAIPLCHMIELAHTRQMEKACDRGSVALTGGVGLTEAILWRSTVMNDTAEPYGLRRIAQLLFTRHHPFTSDRIRFMQEFLDTQPAGKMEQRRTELERILALTADLSSPLVPAPEAEGVKRPSGTGLPVAQRRFAAHVQHWGA